MPEQLPRRTKSEDIARVDSLLKSLGDSSKRDPSPAVRERLSLLASERLSRDSGVDARPQVRWKPIFASACLLATGLIAGLVHFLDHKAAPGDRTTWAGSLAALPQSPVHALPAVQSSVSEDPKVYRQRTVPKYSTVQRQMTVRLPYSNSAIKTGTGTTIQVSMSQSDLLSLGFPINATVQDRRIMAKLTLGDDGLPRAISLPMPLEVMKEKK